ncbi:uncharacterized protein K452DRAFT_297679 [Aplosporella prunicola CBS 121167]|uniref:Shugoshin C-terminal domain-containing protein n=1 Tax=Aplosporella prunicola CBS 121167 TaxID=1176127 RepID=A0A6A6BHQ6_9PEZI|nr:uncharacterized protein K452DRAFT_297679 [Aplosporella prunicola CBS 121167]KAF2142377.1 hypothetical protein K452DRAFT_297679 [Aplosporella prunicola CBS 121167]
MARLNEVPQPAESIESLKRRFIRQNRELAKNNSNQSVRIRGLESEQNRLLQENLSLREQVIQLQHELENTQGHNAVRHIGSVKDKLEAKIQELGGLVAELGSLQKPACEKTSEATEPSRSREIYEWKQSMKEQMEEPEGVLPTIREDKYYPRRTLNSEEIRAALIGDSNESPDLGPPPVAHFADEDPIKFDPKPAEEDKDEELPDAVHQDEEEIPAALSVNLETRRRRRDSSTKLDLRRMSGYQPTQEDGEPNTKDEADQNQHLRAGTKRKLSATGDDLRAEAGDQDLRDEFRFSRRSSSKAERGENAVAAVDNSVRQPSKLDLLVAAERKALGSKSINNTSPKKTSKASGTEEKLPSKKGALSGKDPSRNRARERRAKSTSVTIAPPENMNGAIETADIVVEQEPAELPPKTPADLNLFSPPSTEPSAREEPKDTPSVENPNAAAANSEGPVGIRQARRARAQVNYAEPNLVSKMRRPTKEMADAVVDGRRSSSSEGKSAPSTANPMRTVVIKKDRSEDPNSAWKSLPAASRPEPGSPLSKKTAPSTEKEETEEKEPERTDERPSKSATAMKDLMSSSSRRRPSKAVTFEAETGDRADLAIFDFNDSSPAERESNAIMKSSRDLVRASRRHSSINSVSKESNDTKDENEDRKVSTKNTKSSSTVSATGEKSERKTSRRRSMMV